MNWGLWGENLSEKLMTQFISEFPNQVTVIALGPLTNIARTLLLQPQIAKLVKETVIMGGAFEIPGLVKQILSKNQDVYDVIVTLGCIIKGETPHFNFMLC